MGSQYHIYKGYIKISSDLKCTIHQNCLSANNINMMRFFFLLSMVMISCHGAPPKASDVEFSMDDIKSAADYKNLCYSCSKILVEVNGRLQKYETYSAGYIEAAMKVTKNYSGPKIQYLVGAGLMKIHSGEEALET